MILRPTTLKNRRLSFYLVIDRELIQLRVSAERTQDIGSPVSKLITNSDFETYDLRL
jgi:hypothetical protein